MSIDTMSHEQATSIQAAERYALGKLGPEEREAFESHYFDCPDCFEQVRLEMHFRRHAKEVLGPGLEQERSWLERMLADMRRPAPAFACVLLVTCFAGLGTYQRNEIARLKEPKLGERYTLTGDQRSAVKGVKSQRNDWFTLNVDVSRDDKYLFYQAEIISETGKKRTSPLKPIVSTEGPVAISLLAGTLDGGRNSIVVYRVTASGGRAKAGQAKFDLQFLD